MDYRNLEPDVYTEKVHFHIYRIGGGEFFFYLKYVCRLEHKSVYKAKIKLQYIEISFQKMFLCIKVLIPEIWL